MVIGTSHIQPSRDQAMMGTQKKLDNQRAQKYLLQVVQHL